MAVFSYWKAIGVAGRPLRLRFWDTRNLSMPQLRLMYLLASDDRAMGEFAKALYEPATDSHPSPR
ncbi:MAG TPA: hypothetical protein VFK32_05505 [Tepidiformaceae bacterium]|nr:hypothetical protein [Tepidiformaceae bacterium]